MDVKQRILFVDDDQDTRVLVATFLAREGFEVVAVDCAEEAIRLAMTGTFDAYLFDNWMPEFSGMTLCRAVREFDHHNPIVFYSAAAHEGVREEALLSGAQYYLTKPTDPLDLVAALRSALALNPTSLPIFAIAGSDNRS